MVFVVMKRIPLILLALLLISLFPAMAVAEVSGKRVVKNEKNITEFLFYDNEKLIGKEIFATGTNNLIGREGILPDGVIRISLENEILEITYKGNRRNGPFKKYTVTQRLKAEGSYKNDKLEGIYREYYDNTNLKGEWNYREDKLNGTVRVYYDNGRLREETAYKEGKKEGLSTVYYNKNESVIQYRLSYLNGKLSGISEAYNENGVKKAEVYYKNDDVDGIFKSYSDKGILLKELNYKQGKLHGICRFYYDSGDLMYTDTYNNGFKTNRKKYNQEGRLEFNQDY